LSKYIFVGEELDEICVVGGDPKHDVTVLAEVLVWFDSFYVRVSTITAI